MTKFKIKTAKRPQGIDRFRFNRFTMFNKSLNSQSYISREITTEIDNFVLLINTREINTKEKTDNICSHFIVSNDNSRNLLERLFFFTLKKDLGYKGYEILRFFECREIFLEYFFEKLKTEIHFKLNYIILKMFLYHLSLETCKEKKIHAPDLLKLNNKLYITLDLLFNSLNNKHFTRIPQCEFNFINESNQPHDYHDYIEFNFITYEITLNLPEIQKPLIKEFSNFYTLLFKNFFKLNFETTSKEEYNIVLNYITTMKNFFTDI